jgi:hypothetical protein
MLFSSTSTDVGDNSQASYFSVCGQVLRETTILSPWNIGASRPLQHVRTARALHSRNTYSRSPCMAVGKEKKKWQRSKLNRMCNSESEKNFPSSAKAQTTGPLDAQRRCLTTLYQFFAMKTLPDKQSVYMQKKFFLQEPTETVEKKKAKWIRTDTRN